MIDNGDRIRTFTRRGVVDLYDLLVQEPEFLHGAFVAEKVIGKMAVDVLDIGAVHFPSGTIFACDPLVELEDTI